MSGVAVAVMAAVCGMVWGGFALLLVLALRRGDGGSGDGRRGDGG